MGPLIVAIVMGAVAVFVMVPVYVDLWKQGAFGEIARWWRDLFRGCRWPRS
jgi:hypothetical protein